MPPGEDMKVPSHYTRSIDLLIVVALILVVGGFLLARWLT